MCCIVVMNLRRIFHIHLWTVLNLLELSYIMVEVTSTENDGNHIQNGMEIDWVENATVCNESQYWTAQSIFSKKPYSHCADKELYSAHIPMKNSIQIPSDHLPNSGDHREEWAVYGEHAYVPPGHFVHNLEHGAAVFMYHPCTPPSLVTKFKSFARRCTWQHLIFAYPFILNRTYPLAILTWGCEYRMSNINVTDIQLFMKKRKKSPELVYKQGSYNHSLIQYSAFPDHDKGNHDFCEKVATITTSSALQNANLQTTISHSPVKTPRNKGEAMWAVGSLAFLLVGLILAVCYTQLWRKGNHGESFEKSRLWNDESQPGSVSVAAIVRKLPIMIRNKMDRVRTNRISNDKRYHRVLDDEQSYSEDEV